MAKLTLSIDRRSELRDQVLAEVSSLRDTIRGFTYQLFQESDRPDQGKFRDFAPVAELAHDERDALYAVAEELVDQFGWAIDLSSDE